MSDAPIETEERVWLREKLAHIDLMLAQHDHARVGIDTLLAQHDQARVSINELLARTDLTLAQHNRANQEMRLAPWALVVSSMTAGAAFFAAAFALAKFLMP